MQQTLSLKDAASEAGVTYPAADLWSREGLIPLVARQRRGRGYVRMVDVRGILLMRLIGRCARLGMTAGVLKSVSLLLAGMSLPELRRAATQGRRFVVLGNDSPRLITAAAIQNANTRDLPVVIDIGHELRAIEDSLKSEASKLVG